MELMFRAWDHDLKYMFVIGDMPDLVIGFDGHVYDKGCAFTSQIKCVSSGLTLMQFSGLQDCNGVDIYAGDIVKHEKGSHVVKQIHGCWMFERKADHYINAHWYMKTAEIIGNIHQNPELLDSNNGNSTAIGDSND